MRDELEHLYQRLDAALTKKTQANCASVAAIFKSLSLAALDEISRCGMIQVPEAEDLHAGDDEALHRLYGLIPGHFVRENGRNVFAYRGTGYKELRAITRPPDARSEQLAIFLITVYRLATGREPGRGDQSPFNAFFTELMGYLRRDKNKAHGEKALRRAVKWRKSLISKAK